MRDALKIFHFGWPYLRRYWFRLVVGIVLGVLFGISNASFVWATKTLFERLAPRSDTRLVVGTNSNLSIVISTNALPHLSVADGGKPILLISNTAILNLEVDPDLLTNGMMAATGEYLDSKKIAAKPGFVRRGINWFDALVDPWLPLMGRPIDARQLIGGLLFLPILVAFRGYIGYLSSYCMAWVSERVIRDLRLDLLAKLNTLSMDFFNRSTIGELLMRVNGDTGALYRCLSLGFSDLIKEPVSIIGILIALFAVNWKLTLLAVIFTPLTLIPIRVLGKKVRNAITSGISQGMMQDSLLVEVYTSIRVVKAFCLEKMQLQRFSDIYQRLLRIGMKSTQARELVNPTVETISMLGLGVVILYIFVFGVTAPQLIGFLTGVTMIFAPIKKLGHLHVYFQQASVGASRLVEIFNEKPSVVEKVDAKPFPQFARDITFEKVRFAYKDAVVVRNFNFTLRRGMRLGIAGESGSGKSTLVNLVFRFYDPKDGRILFDGTDLRELSLFDVRQQMALVSQEIVIFDQTVAENIACGREGATRAEVEAAARSASAHDFIMQLPEGYETRVGERGVTLSGGQRQRICIARAFVRNAPILVLDEATAALDSQAESEVQGAIDRLAENRTVICIAHRLSTLANMDHILVMKDGKVVEQDTFGKLIKANGIFADMARKQGIYTPEDRS